jgi:hypothetical protein
LSSASFLYSSLPSCSSVRGTPYSFCILL